MVMPEVAVMGFAPHSGWAAVVVVGGPNDEPRVLARTRVEMSDPRDESRQPYHAVEALGVDEAARRLDGYRGVAEGKAYAAIRAIVEDLDGRGYRVASVGLLESSGRKGSSLASILASHALIHAADGDHFRDALAAAAERSHLPVSRVRAHDLDAQAEARLRRPASRLRETVKQLGRQVGPPWGADQKMAALLAWLLLDQAPAHDEPTGQEPLKPARRR
jgi:hypothetical protein